jgi:hypothetical protein
MALAKMQLNVTIASLGRGHHIECKDLEELLESEDTIRTACKNLTRYLEVADTFDGSELVIEYVNGEEKVHVAQNAPPLLEYSAAEGVTTNDAESLTHEPSTPAPAVEALSPVHAWWAQLDNVGRGLFIITSVVLLGLVVRACVG